MMQVLIIHSCTQPQEIVSGFGFAVSQVESLSPDKEASQLDYSNYYAIKVPLVWIAAPGEFLQDFFYFILA